MYKNLAPEIFSYDIVFGAIYLLAYLFFTSVVMGTLSNIITVIVIIILKGGHFVIKLYKRCRNIRRTVHESLSGRKKQSTVQFYKQGQ